MDGTCFLALNLARPVLPATPCCTDTLTGNFSHNHKTSLPMQEPFGDLWGDHCDIVPQLCLALAGSCQEVRGSAGQDGPNGPSYHTVPFASFSPVFLKR